MPELGVHLWERDPQALAAKAIAAEAAGFASISVGDHVGPGMLPPFAAAAILSSATSRIHFGPLVLNNDLRHPAVVAQEASALSRWSGGRFELALGSGYNRREYEALGLPFEPGHVRAARVGEAAAIIRRLLSGETVSIEGDHYTIHELTFGEPSTHIPILIGGNSRAIHRIAAEHADVCTLAGYSPGSATNDFGTDAVTEQVAFLHRERASDATPLELHVLVQWHEITDDRERALVRAAAELETSEAVVSDSPYALVGTPRQIADQMVSQQAQFGISRWTIFGDRPAAAPAAAFAPVLALLGTRGRE